MAALPVKRIMVYTHNSHGLGHSNRVLSLITGIKKIAPKIDFLVVSGTGVPQAFLAKNIEVVKLPSTKIVEKGNKFTLGPRMLLMGIEKVIELRQKILLDCFESFEPDVFIAEHFPGGQGGEIMPILLKKWRLNKCNQKGFVTVFITRGIIDSPTRINVEWKKKEHFVSSIDIANLYDLVYVMEDKKVINLSKDYLGIKNFSKKAKYLGNITIKTKTEIPNANRVRAQYGIPKNKKMILVSLGRWKGVFNIIKLLTEIFPEINKNNEYILRIQVDPFLDKKEMRQLAKNTKQEDISFVGYTPDLINLIGVSDLVVCRAGYNTIAEVLLTNAKAIIFPEKGRTEEEVYRAEKISSNPNISYLNESKLAKANFFNAIKKLLGVRAKNNRFDFNKYKIGETILRDIRRVIKNDRD